MEEFLAEINIISYNVMEKKINAKKDHIQQQIM